MRATLIIALLGVLTLLSFADTASAGLFGRIRARRRAQLSAEVSYQVSRRVAGAEERLAADLDSKLQTEAGKLESHVEQEIANLRKQAADLVAAESQKLQQQMTAEIAKLHAVAKEAIAAEAKKLQQQVQDQVAVLKSEADKQLQDAVARLDTRLNDNMNKINEQSLANMKKIEELATSSSQNMQTGLEGQIARLKAEMKDMIQSEVAAKTGSGPESTPEPTAPAPPPEQAIETEPARLQTEQQQ